MPVRSTATAQADMWCWSSASLAENPVARDQHSMAGMPSMVRIRGPSVLVMVMATPVETVPWLTPTSMPNGPRRPRATTLPDMTSLLKYW